MKKMKKNENLVEGIKWLGENSFDDLYDFTDADNNYGIVGMRGGSGDIAQIRTSEGIVDVEPNDFIIKDTDGEFQSLKMLLK
jgi:hypothetical protein